VILSFVPNRTKGLLGAEVFAGDYATPFSPGVITRKQMNDLRGKAVLITGGTMGIGLARHDLF
jgi:hypothetical protein